MMNEQVQRRLKRLSPVQEAPSVVESEWERPMTARELLLVPDIGERYELVRGRLLRRSFGSFQAGVTGGHVGTVVGTFVQEHKLGVTLAAAGFVLATDPDTVRAPSIAFVRAERLPFVEPDFYVPGPPDLAIDIDCGWDSFSYFVDKTRDYLDGGTRLVWVIEPVSRCMFVTRRDGSGAFLRGDNLLDGEDVLLGFSLPVRALFDD